MYEQKGRGLAVSVLLPVQAIPAVGPAIPQGAGFISAASRIAGNVAPEAAMDKDRKEALQVAKELTAKFIETRTVSPGNFAEIFPSVYRVVYAAVREGADEDHNDRAKA